MYIDLFIYFYLFIYLYIYMCVCIYLCIYIYILYIHIFIYIYILSVVILYVVTRLGTIGFCAKIDFVQVDFSKEVFQEHQDATDLASSRSNSSLLPSDSKGAPFAPWGHEDVGVWHLTPQVLIFERHPPASPCFIEAQVPGESETNRFSSTWTSLVSGKVESFVM